MMFRNRKSDQSYGPGLQPSHKSLHLCRTIQASHIRGIWPGLSRDVMLSGYHHAMAILGNQLLVLHLIVIVGNWA